MVADILNRQEVAGQRCHSCPFSLNVNDCMGFGECELEVDKMVADNLSKQEVTSHRCHSHPFSLIVNDSVGFDE